MKFINITLSLFLLAGYINAQSVTMTVIIDAETDTPSQTISYITADFTPSFYSGITSVHTLYNKTNRSPFLTPREAISNIRSWEGLDQTSNTKISLEFRSPIQAKTQYIVIQRHGVSVVYNKFHNYISHIVFPQELSKTPGLIPKFNLVYTSLE